jgi:tetrahydromethanopterin S-methyltransferase subunit H
MHGRTNGLFKNGPFRLIYNSRELPSSDETSPPAVMAISAQARSRSDTVKQERQIAVVASNPFLVDQVSTEAQLTHQRYQNHLQGEMTA